jgi:probable F420-dependent oxidoreductase
MIGGVLNRAIRIGMQLAQYGAPWGTLVSTAHQAEAMGIDMLFNWDHFFGPGPDSTEPHLECWTLLAGWAATTSRMELGPLVSAIGYRNPDLVADMARTIDHISAGRFVLGLGAGFKERDYAEYGYPLGSPASRVAELAQGLVRIRRRLASLNPPPLRSVPILIGGSGERTLRVVAEHADIWHTFAEGEQFARKSALLDQYCREIGRDPAEIERAVLVRGDPIREGDPFLELGATLFVISVADRPEPSLQPVAEWLAWRDRHNATSTLDSVRDGAPSKPRE